MKLFLATDALDDVHWATVRGWCDGVVLPDAALRTAASPEAAVAWLGSFARAVPVPVLVDATEALNSGEEGLAQVRALGRASDNVVLQCPFTDENALLVRTLSSAGFQVAMTFVGTATQALLAAKAGASFVLVDVDRLEAMNGTGARVMREARALLDAASLETELVALFPQGPAVMAACGISGADAAVVGAATLRAMIAYPFSDQALVPTQREPSRGQRLRAGDP